MVYSRFLQAGLVVWTVLVLLFLIVPILAIMPIAFSSGSFLSYPLPGFSLRWFATITEGYPWMFALKNSFIVAVATVALAVPIGSMAAYGLAVSPFRGKDIVLATLISPMVVPVVITGLSSFFFLTAVGLFGSYLGLILAHTVLAIPFVVIPVAATLQRYDMTLNRAAASLGAPPWQAFRQVTLPLIMPGVLSGAVFAFITSFDDVVVALFVSSPSTLTLPRQLFSSLRSALTPSLVAIAFVLIIISCLLMCTAELLRRGRGASRES
jgi:putative spermidine/putrescine transport system permease protein